MKKILIISTCDDCPNFDNEYWGYEEECVLLNRIIPRKDKLSSSHDIPEDCPLEDYYE